MKTISSLTYHGRGQSSTLGISVVILLAQQRYVCSPSSQFLVNMLEQRSVENLPFFFEFPFLFLLQWREHFRSHTNNRQTKNKPFFFPPSVMSKQVLSSRYVCLFVWMCEGDH